jgi:hypothetical protein
MLKIRAILGKFSQLIIGRVFESSVLDQRDEFRIGQIPIIGYAAGISR